MSIGEDVESLSRVCLGLACLEKSRISESLNLPPSSCSSFSILKVSKRKSESLGFLLKGFNPSSFNRLLQVVGLHQLQLASASLSLTTERLLLNPDKSPPPLLLFCYLSLDLPLNSQLFQHGRFARRYLSRLLLNFNLCRLNLYSIER